MRKQDAIGTDSNLKGSGGLNRRKRRDVTCPLHLPMCLILVMDRICALSHARIMESKRLTQLAQLLSDPTRRNALALLRGGEELCVCELMASLGATQSRMSRHMGALKEAGLVVDRRDAQWVRYRIASDLDPATSCILDAVLAATSPPIRKSSPANNTSHDRRLAGRIAERAKP